MHYNEYTLPNGLRIIHEPTLSKVAYCGFAIDAGTRDEAEHEQGMAHFGISSLRGRRSGKPGTSLTGWRM